MMKASEVTAMTVRLATLLALAPSILAACGSSNECPEPIYDGKASDEARLTMIDGEKIVRVGDPMASTMIDPTRGQTYSMSAPPPLFRWSSPLVASLEPAFRKPRERTIVDRL